jgi:hypothetical protein
VPRHAAASRRRTQSDEEVAERETRLANAERARAEYRPGAVGVRLNRRAKRHTFVAAADDDRVGQADLKKGFEKADRSSQRVIVKSRDERPGPEPDLEN